MIRPALTRSMAAVALALGAAAGPAGAAGKVHQHGVVKLDVAVEGPKLTIALEAPLDNLLGFERAPRTDAERRAAADVLARLRRPEQAPPLLAPDSAAQCRLSRAEVIAPVLEPGAKAQGKDEHADAEARYEFDCAQPAELRSLELGLFDAYRRIQRIEVQVAGAQGQSKLTLKRPARKVPLRR